jgi:hypothetical protein
LIGFSIYCSGTHFHGVIVSGIFLCNFKRKKTCLIPQIPTRLPDFNFNAFDMLCISLPFYLDLPDSHIKSGTFVANILSVFIQSCHFLLPDLPPPSPPKHCPRLRLWYLTKLERFTTVSRRPTQKRFELPVIFRENSMLERFLQRGRRIGRLAPACSPVRSPMTSMEFVKRLFAFLMNGEMTKTSVRVPVGCCVAAEPPGSRLC